MTTTISSVIRARRWIGQSAALAAMTLASVASGAHFGEAKVTAVVKDVKLLSGQAVPRPAAVNDQVRKDTAVRTGLESRSELEFPDLTLARLGANTIFSFNEEAREVNLFNGAILLRVPKNSGGAKITTDAVTAGIIGTTVMMEFHPRGIAKFIVLEGVARLYLKNRVGESILVHAGQMMIVRAGATHLDDPVDVDIPQIMKTSLLITGFGPLPSDPLIAREESNQTQRKSEGQLIDTNLVIYGSGTLVSLVDPTSLNTIDQATASTLPPPTPAPGKFGPPSVIALPVPYVINDTTAVQTDPTITTNGVTDFGKIYRGRAIDGPASAFFFGSTSAFDTSSGFDDQIGTGGGGSGGTGSGAGFKFNSLRLSGNPTVSTTNGETNLGLIALNGITSGTSGGKLTFAGIRGLLLATQNGSINLGSQLAFSGLDDITFYARGTGSDLTLSSPVSVNKMIRLYSEGSIQVNAAETVTPQVGNSSSIKMTSGKKTGVAINISSSAQLLALLGPANPNSSGVIEILASAPDNTRNSSQINVSGQVQAEGGTVDIRHSGDSGVINLNNSDIRADVIKAAALGSSGSLNITGGSLSADSILQLYSAGSNGTVNFLANVNLASPASIIAANTVNIFNGVVVTIKSDSPADVFTNNANYTGFGGNGSRTGTFAGAGANRPQPLANAPPLDPPGP